MATIAETLAPAVEEWLAASDLSHRTQAQYRWHLLAGELSLARWLDREQVHELSSLTRTRLVFWRRSLLDRYAPTTANQAISAARGVIRWMEAENAQQLRFDLSQPLSDVLKPPRIPVAPQETVLPDEYETLLDSLSAGTVKGVRDRALLTMLYETGMRSCEFVSLTTGDLRLQDRHGWALVRSRKGGDVGEVVFGAVCRERLGRWLDVRRSEGDALWVGVAPPFEGNPMTQDGLRTIIGKWCRAAGLRRLSPHDFRRGAALYHLKHATSREWVLRQFGWTDDSMYRHYTQALPLHEFNASYSIVDRLAQAQPRQLSLLSDAGEP